MDFTKPPEVRNTSFDVDVPVRGKLPTTTTTVRPAAPPRQPNASCAAGHDLQLASTLLARVNDLAVARQRRVDHCVPVLLNRITKTPQNITKFCAKGTESDPDPLEELGESALNLRLSGAQGALELAADIKKVRDAKASASATRVSAEVKKWSLQVLLGSSGAAHRWVKRADDQYVALLSPGNPLKDAQRRQEEWCSFWLKTVTAPWKSSWPLWAFSVPKPSGTRAPSTPLP